MRITENQLRRIIREELLQDATLADVEPELASMQRDYDTSQSQDPQDDPHIYAGKKRHIANRRDTKRLWNKHADLSFFNDPKELFVWHYLGHFSYNKSLSDYFPPDKVKIGAVPGIDLPARDELSCYGKIVSDMTHPPDEESYFTFKEYRVTFASKGDAETERLSRATPAQVEEGIREYIRRNAPPSEAVRDTIRRLIKNPSGDVKSYVLSLIEAPVDDGNDPYAYRGIIVRTDTLRTFGVDPTGLPGGTWVDLKPEEEERDAYDDEEEGTATLPTPREVPLPTPPEMTTSSWTYNPAIAKRFAEAPTPGRASIVLAAHVQDNFPKFLELFPLYRAVDAEGYSGETELMGVASNRDPIRGFVRFIRLP